MGLLYPHERHRNSHGWPIRAVKQGLYPRPSGGAAPN